MAVKIIFEEENLDDLEYILNARRNDALVFHLKNNFHREWKYIEGSKDYKKGIEDVLKTLRQDIAFYTEKD